MQTFGVPAMTGRYVNQSSTVFISGQNIRTIIDNITLCRNASISQVGICDAGGNTVTAITNYAWKNISLII